MFERKTVTVAWHTCCKGIANGSLGFRDLTMSNKIFLKKKKEKKKNFWDIILVITRRENFLSNDFYLLDGSKNMGPCSAMFSAFKPIFSKLREESR